MKNQKTLSVIVPAFKQEANIRRDLKSIDKVLSAGLLDANYEIICVVDGFVDNTFSEALKVKSPTIKVFGYERNKGKGYAVRYGMARSSGDLISFLDSGMDI